MLPFNNILFPLNLDSKNLTHVAYAVRLARESNSTIHFLYINDPHSGYRYPTDFQDAVALRVKEVVPADILEGANVRYATDKGDLGDSVAAYCRAHKIDLIVTGHKHRNRLYAALFEDPNKEIIEAVLIPLMIVPKN